MRIRYAQETDSQALEDFLAFNNGNQWRELARNYIGCMFSKDFRRPSFMVAEEQGHLIGAAAFSEEMFTVGIWGISWVSVHPDYRRQGIGEKLIRACMEEIGKKVRGAVTVILNTYPEKTKLYDKVGFSAMGKDHDGGALMVCHMGLSS